MSSKGSSSKKLTPMMKQYFSMKEANPDVLLLYRLGDFYEMFYEDAKIAANVLGLTLTKRNHGGDGETPLAGFPYHALDRYAHKLVKAGHRIAVCEQIEDPKTAKGVVKRDIVEIISAGTGMDDAYLQEGANMYVAAIAPLHDQYGLAVCDLSTGEFFTLLRERDSIIEEIVRLDPVEIVKSLDCSDSLFSDIDMLCDAQITKIDPWRWSLNEAEKCLMEHFSVNSLQGLGLEDKGALIISSGALLAYLKEQKRSPLSHIQTIRVESGGTYAQLDPSTIRNLELLKPLQSDETGGTLISILDKTVTSLGSRLLRKWLVRPLYSIVAIEERYNAVEWFMENLPQRTSVERLLKSVGDIERLMTKVSMGRANGRDLISLGRALEQLPLIYREISGSSVNLIDKAAETLLGFDDLVHEIVSTVVPEPPLSIRDGGVIRSGVDPELDEYRDAAINGKEWIAKIQQTEREKTGIDSLKIGYNKVFGYYLETSKVNASKVPDYFIRRQTLANAERFITPELKEIETKVLSAEGSLSEIEYTIFNALRERVAGRCEAVQKAAESVALIDLLASFARLAFENSYIRPTLREDASLFIEGGRHPVVEQMVDVGSFVPNDTQFIEGEQQIYVITGPNMAGKSTYLRQNALICLLAQIGCFVPASRADIGLVDRFFTRIGASDRLARGQSTFLVEMVEVADILNNATDRSFVLLDEVGRGTSTYDGVSIARAVIEYLHETEGRKPRTLFATHYHELVELEESFSRITNRHIQVREYDGKIIFLRKIAEGGASHSYGIEVASLAGIPKAVTERAKEILRDLEGLPLPQKAQAEVRESVKHQPLQTNLFDEVHPVIESLKGINIHSLTPLEALNRLAELQTLLG